MNPPLQLPSRVAALWLAALAAHGEVVINEFMAHGSERLLRWSADGVPTLGYGLPWYAPAHDDSRWLTGNGPFGFGSFTNVSPAPSFGTNTAGQMQNLTPTLYLRKSFQVSAADAARADALRLVVQFNDGFVLYLNGKEVIRRNAGPPNGFVYHDQFAAFGTPATNEPGTTPYARSETLTLAAANTLLVPGDNLLAVHALNHWESTFCTNTSNNTFVTVNNRDNFLFKGDLQIAGSSPVTLVSNNSAWKYFSGVAEPSGGVHDTALLFSGKQSVPWGSAAYDDSAWTSGSAPFGAGPPPAGQTLGTDLSAALLNQTPSAYFRVVFTATAADLLDANALQLLIDYDDGFVAYLNGIEVARANMGQANAFTPHDAVASAERTPGTATTYTLDPPARHLNEGQNVLAVQVHNFAVNNPDLFFRARLQRNSAARILVDYNAAWNFFVGIQEPVLSEDEALEDNPEPPDSSLDWVELHNSSDSPVDLGGWSLSDDPTDPVKWTFPAGVEIGAMGFLLVVCDGLDITDPASDGLLHTNFRLAADGEYLSLAEPGGHVVQQFAPAYPPQTAFQSYGRNSGGMLRYFDTPSPGSANTGPTFEGIVSPPEFSLQSGFHSGTQSLALSCATASAQIRYTTDGSEPEATSGLAYTGLLSLGASTAIRARAFLAGMIPSQSVTRSFLVNEPESRKSVPALCFTGDPQRALYRPFGVMAISGGSYINNASPLPTTYNTIWSQTLSSTPSSANLAAYNHPIHRGRFLERPVGLELLHPSGLTPPLNTLAGLRIAGSGHARPRYRLTNQNRIPGSVPGPNDGPWSQTAYTEKPSFNLFFRDELGGDPLSYPLFPGSPVTEFHDLRLRAGKNDVSNPFVEDELMRRLFIDLGQVGSRGIINTLYVNGVYKGYFNLCEHLREDFFRRHHGSDLAWDVRQVTAIASGDGLAFQEMINFIRNNPQHLSANYQGMQARLDLVNFIDYLIVNLLGVTGDWPHNNYVAARERSTDAQYRYHVWDAEGAFGDFNGTVRTNQFLDAPQSSLITTTPLTVGIERAIQVLYTLLKASPEFRLLFADRLHRHFFNGGALTQARVLARLGELRTELLPLLGAAAFTDKVTPWVNGVGDNFRYTLSGGTTGTVVNAPSRSRVLFDGYTDEVAGGTFVQPHLVDEGLWPTTRPPMFSTFGGTVPAGFRLTITNPGGGVIYFTTDGTDPRDPGGAVHGTAYAGPVTISFPTTVKARVLFRSVWSALTEALFDPGTSEPLLVTEVMYHPADDGPIDGDEFEFIEIKNTGDFPLALDGMRFTEGISHTFPDGATLAPDTHLVLARNPARFALRYPGVTVAGSWDSNSQLANQGERLTLVNAAGRTLFSVAWTDTAPWPEQADGAGHSLVPVQTDANPAPDNPASWRASTALHGSPGADDPLPPIPVLVHELLANPIAPATGRLELHNPNDFAIDIGHWWISDDEGIPMKFRLPADTLIPAHGFLVLTEADWSPAGVSFPSIGGTAVLSAADAGGSLTGFRHCVTFGASDPGVSFGRHLNSAGAERFVAQSATTFGTPNAGPRVGPVVITEIMYHPADGGWEDEFLEIRNISSAPVPMFDPAIPSNCWSVDGIGFTFPAGTVLQPGQTLLLSPIDPATFRARYAIKPGITILGPFPGKLDNGGERIALQKPGPPYTPPSGLPVVPRIDVDTPFYQDVAPWPVAADGGGPSLERTASGAFADDPAHWRASLANGGSPGLATALSFADWRSQRFTAGQIATPGIGGDSDDPDGDGLANLAEWALGTDPWRPDQAPLSWQMEPPDGSGHFTVRVRISQSAAGLGVFADTSTDLSAWLPGGGIPVDPAIDHGDGTETRVFRLPDPVAAHPSQFVRIRLTTQ